jgi:hypothetical protein
MFGRLSARICILSTIRFADALVTIESVVSPRELDGGFVNTRCEDVRVRLERSELGTPNYAVYRAHCHQQQTQS